MSAIVPHEKHPGRVFVVDDDGALCDTLRQLMESVQIPVETYEDGRAFLDAWKPGMRGCLILDVRMPRMSGYEVLKELRAQSITMPVILFSAHGSIRLAVQAMRAGAFDFIEKPFDEQELLDVVYRALKRDAEVKGHESWLRRARVRYETLTGREKSVFVLIASGLLNKEIADELDISVRTVENHRANVIKKMDSKTVADLVKLAIGLRKIGRIQTGA